LTANELAILALGLIVGAAAGAGLVEVLRNRPRSEREVRVTVARDAVPRRRSATLGGDPFSVNAKPARGGPAEGQRPDASAPTSDGPSRTPVRSPAALTVAGSGAPTASSGPTRMVAVPMGGGVDPLIDVLRSGRAPAGAAVSASSQRSASQSIAATSPGRADEVTPSWPGAGAPRAAAQPTSAEPVTPAEPPKAEQPTRDEPAPPAASSPAEAAPGGPCDEPRRVADERCEVASRARTEAERGQDTLRAAQRSYDEHLAHADESAHTADPRTVRSAKDAAQEAFRTARSTATTPEGVDAAARDWLLEINRINGEVRTAQAAAAKAQEAARDLAGSLERLSAEADAARIAAEAADVACVAARQALADCVEEAAAKAAAKPAADGHSASPAPGSPWQEDAIPATVEAESTRSALDAGTAPTIFRLLQGDQAALHDVVARLAGDDPDQRRQWQLAISDLVDAILATAIENAALEFPEEHPFWGPFTLQQSREIVAALASLGYRYDGLGGWQDGRIPSQRDLSLALGYAGLDPMRMRQWPNEAQMFELMGGIRVAAPEYLAESAGDLTLGELVDMLGRRAEGLAEVWNAWGRVRPLLLEER